jgi:hypothetical protein
MSGASSGHITKLKQSILLRCRLWPNISSQSHAGYFLVEGVLSHSTLSRNPLTQATIFWQSSSYPGRGLNSWQNSFNKGRTHWGRCYKHFRIVLYKDQYYETLFVSNLRIVCPRQAFPALSNKRSSLVIKFVNYGHKKLKKIGPRPWRHDTQHDDTQHNDTQHNDNHHINKKTRHSA